MSTQHEKLFYEKGETEENYFITSSTTEDSKKMKEKASKEVVDTRHILTLGRV